MNKQGPGKIDWTDYTWNPLTGCWGPGGTAENPKRCFYCYAHAGKERFGQGFEPTFHRERLWQPTALKKPSKIFVCSVSDLFADWVPREWIEAVLEAAKQAPQHTFQFLTKNPKRLAEFNWPPNAWVGATATDQETYEESLMGLENVEAETHFISIEPLLGPIKVRRDIHAVEWLIIGALTGRHKARWPVRREWVEDIERAADQAGVPVWEKDSLKPVFEGGCMPRDLRKEWPTNG